MSEPDGAPPRSRVADTRPPPTSRLATIAVVVAVVALSAFADRSSKSQRATGPVVAMPVAGPRAALSSSWFCAGPVAGSAHLADGRLVVANAASRPLTGKVTFIPSSGPALTEDIQVGPANRVVVPEKMTAGVPYLGAVVELDGGQAVVQQVVAGTTGISSTACATTGATSWYFAAGTTQESATLSLSLLNPYPDDAIADLSFTTEQGQENPQDFQGIVIPAGTMAGLDLGTHLRRRASVATTVTLRVGRVAAFETQTVQAQSPAAAATAPPGTTPWPPGVSLVRGAPTAATSWWWPAGGTSDGVTEQYVIYNPGVHQAQVSLEIDLDQGSADPFQVTVDPHAVAVVATSAESRVPKGLGHGAGLHSANGVGVVAERLILATSPANPTGLAQILGSRLPAAAWVVPGDVTTDPMNPSVVVYNPGSAPVTISVASLDGSHTVVAGQEAVVIPGHHRYVLKATGPVIPGAVVVAVHGPGQVVVEGDIWPTRGLGINAAIGVPLG